MSRVYWEANNSKHLFYEYHGDIDNLQLQAFNP